MASHPIIHPMEAEPMNYVIYLTRPELKDLWLWWLKWEAMKMMEMEDSRWAGASR